MKLLNVMLARGRGGLEQAALDWQEALAREGHDVVTVGHPRGWLRSALGHEAAFLPLASLGGWDLLAARRLKALARRSGAEALILHGNRAIALAARLSACPADCPWPRIAVVHNFRLKPALRRLEGAIAVSEAVRAAVAAFGFPQDRLAQVPNMIRLAPPRPRPPLRQPAVLGALGRLHRNKGFDLLLEALAILARRGLRPRLRLGGDGPERRALAARVAALGLGEQVELSGWIEAREAFFASLDLFLLPSRVEPFGIVVLEALEAGLPIIASDTEGPAEILTPGEDAVIVPRGDAAALAAAIEELLGDPRRRAALATAARRTAERYALETVAPRLSETLLTLCREAGAASPAKRG